MSWSEVVIAGKAADVFDPPAARAGLAVLYLHPVGLESLAGNVAYTTELTRHRLRCIAPKAGRSWWSDKICPEFDEALTAERYVLDHVVPWVREQWQVSANGLAAVGISMGGQGAIRFGLKHPATFPVVASVAGAFDYHEWYGLGTPIDDMYRSREGCRQDTAVLWVNPNRFPPFVWFACDPDDADWIRGNERLQSKLYASGVPHHADLTTQAGGHSWDYFDAMAAPLLAYVAESLTTSQRRLM